MKRRRRLKQIKKLNLRMKRKLVIVFAIITLALIALIGRLTYINAVSGDKYAKTVLAQQAYNSRTIQYKRGDIVDRNKTILATSTITYNVIVDCKQLNDNEEKIDATVRTLVKAFPQINDTDLRDYIDEHPTSQYYKILSNQSYDEVQDIAQIINDTENNQDITGLWLEQEYIRNYPYHSLAASVLGFMTDRTGSIGLEAQYDDELTGVDGREYGYLNSDSNLEATVISPVDGNTIVSTIDMNIQSIVDRQVLAFNESHRDLAREGEGSKNTSVIVMNPNNGEILAMSSFPTFDCNTPRDLSQLYNVSALTDIYKITVPEDESGDALEVNEYGITSSQESELLNRIWQNYSITQTFEPGSTAKAFTMSAGLDTGKIKEDDEFYCDGGEDVGEYYIHCHNWSGHGVQTLQQCMENSCNDAFMQIGMRIGVDTFTQYQNIFGFGLRTGVDLPNEARTDTLIYNEDNMYITDLATNAFGQNYNVTMVQLAAAFSSVINGGYYYQPHIVSEILDSDGNTVKSIDPIIMRKTISNDTSVLLRSYLEGVVDEGTGSAAKIPGYTIGGKTGTAEKIPRGNGKYVVSFISFVPVDNPQVVVYVVIDEVNDENQAQSNFAVTLARDIMVEILPYLDIFQDTELTEQERAELEYQQALQAQSEEAQALENEYVSDESVMEDVPAQVVEETTTNSVYQAQ